MPPTAPTALATRVGGALALPADLAEAAISAFFEGYHVSGVRCVRDPEVAWTAHGIRLPPGNWAIVLPATRQAIGTLSRIVPKAAQHLIQRGPTHLIVVQPASQITLKQPSARRLKQALAAVQPKQANGLPLPWVTPTAATEALGRPADEGDVVVEASALDAAPEGRAATAWLSDAIIRDDLTRIARRLGLPAIPLTIRRGAVHKRGFVTGRVHLRGSRPLRMIVTTCPNADRAEVAATLLHECVHALTPGAGHAVRFKRRLVESAEAVWGEALFAGARAAISGPYSTIDAWIAVGIRAHLEGRPPPAAIVPGEAAIAVVVRRIQKLRALAHDQLGTPEGCSADARANTLIVTHGLGRYQIALPDDLGAAPCDRWLAVGKRTPWKADVAFAVARFCDVFALSHPQFGGMHLFGRQGDVITAEHLWGVAVEHLERRCAEHMRGWRAANPRQTGSAVTSQRIAFLRAAAAGLSEALREALAGEDAAADRLQAAEDFARVEHEKRGMRWRGGGRGRRRRNAAGFEAGKALRLSRAVEGAEAQRLLGRD